ncbi:hypothetical protein [Pseudobythopirellula maris]|nr:hypothetical protein [Pseudobythopirellula maris]
MPEDTPADWSFSSESCLISWSTWVGVLPIWSEFRSVESGSTLMPIEGIPPTMLARDSEAQVAPTLVIKAMAQQRTKLLQHAAEKRAWFAVVLPCGINF